MDPRATIQRETTDFSSDERAVSEHLALGILLGSAFILAAALAVFVLVGG